MALDSTIRLKQLNTGELAAFVLGLIGSYSSQLPSGSNINSGAYIFDTIATSGVNNQFIPFPTNLGINPYVIPSLNTVSGEGNILVQASGITSSGYTALYSTNINNNGYVLTTFAALSTTTGLATTIIINSGTGIGGTYISIQGPSGATGSTGITGPSGATGISITGAYWSGSSSGLIFQLSNHTTLPIIMIPAFTGASGVSVKSFTQSGNSIYPNFSNNTTGALINLPTGIQGPIGIPGTVVLNFVSGGNPFSKVNFPSEAYLNNYFTTQAFPQLAFMRGMSYTFTLSGLSTLFLNAAQLTLITGIFSGIPNVGLSTTSETAYYADPKNCTGYWRLAFYPSTTTTGIYSGNYIQVPSYPLQTSDITTYNDIYRSLITFNVPYTAQNNYNYGFSLYSIGDTSVASGVYNTIWTGFDIIVGNVVISSGVGPPGQQGAQGIQGQTIVGPPGTPGQNGYALPSVTGAVNVNGTGLYFELINNGVTNTIPIPTGGPVGVPGPSGLPGSITNYWDGNYVNTTVYSQNDTVSRFGSTYVYTGNIPSAGNPPENGFDWQLLAQSGAAGSTGPTGATITYSSNFYVVSGKPTGAGTFATGITGITVNGVSLSGLNAQFTTGQIVSFINSGLIGYPYTPFQQLVVSTNSQTGTYFYATVNSFNSFNGNLSFTVFTGLSSLSGIPGTTINGTEILWYNYNNATINLGANLALVTGAIGPQGLSGQPSLLRQSGQIILTTGISSTTAILDPTNTDCFNIMITGNINQVIYGGYPVTLDFNWAGFPVGKSVLLKIRNSGVNLSAEPNLFVFTGNSTGIQWPNGVYTFPSPNQIYIYTIIRFQNELDGQSGIFGTYSNPYSYSNQY